MTSSFPEHDKLLNGHEAAAFLGITYHTLAVWKSTKRYNVPYVKIGRLVKYRRTDLERFIDENRSEVVGA